MHQHGEAIRSLAHGCACCQCHIGGWHQPDPGVWNHCNKPRRALLMYEPSMRLWIASCWYWQGVLHPK